MIVRMFKPQFATLVESGQKKQTVRPKPKRRILVGDEISLREWTGKPYRSKQRELGKSTITKVERIWINDAGIKIGLESEYLERDQQRDFAHEDGFENLAHFFRWFEETHNLPFEGIVIHWK